MAAVCVQLVWRVRGSLSGEDRDSEDPARTAARRHRRQAQDGRRAHGKVDFPALLVRDDAARPLLFSCWDGAEVFSWEARWGLDQPRAGSDGDSARGWLAEPARSAAASGEELP